jgi:hypothetical protein
LLGYRTKLSEAVEEVGLRKKAKPFAVHQKAWPLLRNMTTPFPNQEKPKANPWPMPGCLRRYGQISTVFAGAMRRQLFLLSYIHYTIECQALGAEYISVETLLVLSL